MQLGRRGELRCQHRIARRAWDGSESVYRFGRLDRLVGPLSQAAHCSMTQYLLRFLNSPGPIWTLNRVKKGFSRGSGEVCLCTSSYVRCAHRPAGLCTPTCSAHRPAQHTDPLCMQIFTAHQLACLLLSFRSKLPQFSFYVLRFALPNVSKVLLKI